MLRTFTRSLRVLFCILLFAIPSFPRSVNPAAAAVDSAEAEKWREDLRHMAREMEARHRNLFHTMTREQFEGAVKTLHERIPALARHQIIEESPHSFRSYHAMGYAHFQAGDREQAVKNLERALELSPKTYEVAELLKQVRKQ